MEQGTHILVGNQSDVEKATFYRKTYSHVALAVLGFVLVEYLFFQSEAIVNLALSLTDGYKWLLLLGGFIFVTNYAEKMAIKSHNRNQQYLALAIYVVAEAFIFIPLLAMAISITGDFSLLSQAAVLTISLFVGLSAVVLITKKDFSFLRSGLMIGGFIAIGLIVAGIIFGFNLGLWFSGAMILLAAGTILYQTSNMVHKYSNDQYVSAALGLFASLMLLFWYLLSFIMNRS